MTQGTAPFLTIETVKLIIELVFGCFTAFFAAYAAYRGKMNGQQIASVKATGEATHILSNSNMAAQLTNAVEGAESELVLFKTIAQLRNDPSDITNVTAAELRVVQKRKLLQDHLIQQSKVDAKGLVTVNVVGPIREKT